MIEKVFDKLRTLQEILSLKFQVQKEIEEIPGALATRTELLNRLKKGYIDKSKNLHDLIESTKKLRTKAIEAEAEREKFEKQMDLIQTQREYEALDKEIRDAGEREQELRRNLQREEQLVEEMKVKLEKEEMMIKQQEEEVEAEQGHIQQEVDSKQKELKKLETREKKITPGLDEAILFKFARIIKNKSGLGIVPIVDGVCSGCHMILPGQFVNTIRSGQEIMFCPNCSRIIFFQDEEKE
ncbi:MAG TPA: nucleic acid-binding protein [Spirochaetales bacterium]|nr:nucleic acid-binding protein [Spirochaetales bacterium]